MFPAFLQHADGHLIFKGDDMTTKQAAMQHSPVLLCCSPKEQDKVSQKRYFFIIFDQHDRVSELFVQRADIMVSGHQEQVSVNDSFEY